MTHQKPVEKTLSELVDALTIIASFGGNLSDEQLMNPLGVYFAARHDLSGHGTITPADSVPTTGKKIYIATSWNSPHLESLKDQIGATGNTYYHFVSAGYLFDYNDIKPGLRDSAPEEQARHVRHSRLEKACELNVENLLNADVFVLCAPAGSGCWVEFGLATQLGIPTVLLVTPEYEIGVMDNLFTHVVYGTDELLDAMMIEHPNKRPSAQLTVKDAEIRSAAHGDKGKRARTTLASIGEVGE